MGEKALEGTTLQSFTAPLGIYDAHRSVPDPKPAMPHGWRLWSRGCPEGGFLSRACVCISRSSHNFSKEQMLFSLGASVNPTEGCPAGSHWAELCKRGHRQCGLLETGAKKEPHKQSKGALPVMCVCGDIDR